jgi:hypothetical protein
MGKVKNYQEEASVTTYFTLIGRVNAESKYEALLGDHDREVVEKQLRDSRDGEAPYLGYMIIATTPDQTSIDARLVTINAVKSRPW